MNREELKRLWWSIPHGKLGVPMRTIVVEFDKNKSRIGQGTVRITCDSNSGYSEFNTHQVDPLQYALDKMNEKYNRLEYNEDYDYSKYQLIIK